MQLPKQIQEKKVDVEGRVIAGLGALMSSFSILFTMPYDIKEYIHSKINKSLPPIYLTKDAVEMAQECEYILLRGRFPTESDMDAINLTF